MVGGAHPKEALHLHPLYPTEAGRGIGIRGGAVSHIRLDGLDRVVASRLWRG